MRVKVDKHTKKLLLDLYEKRKISLEGNILKLIDCDDDKEFREYLDESIKRDKASRRKRLNITKKIQSQNTELNSLNKENNRVNRQLTKALGEAEESKNSAIKALEEAQKAREQAEKSREQAEKSREEAVNARIESEKLRDEAENARASAESDLETIQKKKQFELIGKIVKVALWVILGVGVTTTAMYSIALYAGVDTTVIGSTWSNIISILLTNAFSIVGTIMGIKHATKNSDE
ncbi:MAG: putative motor protein [uncultured marine phage]|uniref:Putative motor protein n=1 Tax=uncultured marine phage TaxID=707152 RepID=A0A8D9FQ25_9VIRU|nr:MAG: putative motor protein [uncultured marine phage]